ncbi:MAG: AraC family transcriptional regulator, partial [Kiritimatiellae bacterium]|nr:AraC family transcriptional regulator [Kiritimatiellia bacterium]
MAPLHIGIDLHPPDADQRRMIMLDKEGVPGIVMLGHSQFRHHSPAAVEHVHEGCVEIVLCQRGALTFKKTGRFYRLMPGDIIVNRPKEKHCLVSYPKGLSVFWLVVRVQPASAALLKLPDRENRALKKALLTLSPQIRRDDGRVRHAFKRMLMYYDAPKGDKRMLGLLGTCLHLLMATIETASHDNSSPVTKRIELVIESMRMNPGDNYMIDDMAHQANLSPGHFMACFKKLTGVPPRQFLLECRI